MSPRRLTDSLRSRFGLFVLFVAVLFIGLWLYGRHRSEAEAAKAVEVQRKREIELGRVRIPLDQGLENGLPQEVRGPTGESNDSSKVSNGIVPFRPPPVVAPPPRTPAPNSVRAAAPPPATPRKLRYPSLLAGYVPEPPRPTASRPLEPERFIPFGTLLKCKLVNTVDSANLETPLIALLLEDVWQNGRLVIPANTLVHGTAAAGRLRDRVTAAGAWRFVWQNGRELRFSGVALDREYDHDTAGFGITDGSAGIKGRLLATDDFQELKLLAASALSGFARGTQDRTQTALGTTITGSVSNGLREGAGNVFDLYAQRTLRDLEENGYFVRVAAGKEFYVYVLSPVDPSTAAVAATNAHPTSQQPTSSPPTTTPTRG